MNQKLRNLVYTAMLMALCCVATLVIKIPTVTGGYLNAGDIVVVLAALLAGPLYGGVAAGFGSGLADVISGYMSYAPGTLVVKGCAAVVTALIFRACRKKSFGFALLSAICGEIIMVLGYFVFEDFILGYGAAAAAEIPGNAAQAAVGIVGGLALYFALNKVPISPRPRWQKSRNKSTPYAKQPLPIGSGCFSRFYTTRTRMTSGMRSIFAT